MKIRHIILILFIISVSGCSSPMYFSHEDATKEEFRISCWQAEENIRESRINKYNETQGYWTDDNPYYKSGSIQGSLTSIFAKICGIGDLTKPFNKNETKEFINNMERLEWTYYSKKPKGIQVFSKKKKLQKKK